MRADLALCAAPGAACLMSPDDPEIPAGADPFDDPPLDDPFDDAAYDHAATESEDRLARRRAVRRTVGRGHRALARRLMCGTPPHETSPDGDAVVRLLYWLPGLADAPRRRALDLLRRQPATDGDESLLARWRSGGLDRDALARAGRRHLDAAPEEPASVLRLHLVLLGHRLGRMPLGRADRDLLADRLRALRVEILDHARAVEDGAAVDDGTLLLAARASEMWRDTAAMARPVRLAVERLARVTWHGVGGDPPWRLAARLVAAGNLRHDDRDVRGLVDRLLAAQRADGTWSDGRGEESLDATVLVLRALEGPRRTGPPR